MKIFIIGAGFTGMRLAKLLTAEKNTVVLIDDDTEQVRTASDQLDCTVIEADGNNLNTLENAGVASADALVVLTKDDEVNMITCSLVDAAYPHIKKIARVRTYDYYTQTTDAEKRHQEQPNDGTRPVFGIDHMVNPDAEAAKAIVRAMEIGAVGSTIEIDGGYGIVVLPIAEGCPLDGIKVRDLTSLEEWHYLIAFVETADGATLPHGGTVLNANDHIGILTRREDLPRLLQFTGATEEPIRKIVIFGADNVGALTLAGQIQRKTSFWDVIKGYGFRQHKQDLTIIDRDSARCREIADKFPDVKVLNGDITDDMLLHDEGICECDLMVAASGSYERNLVTAAYLKSRGARKAIALTADSAFNEIARKLGVDVAVPMRDTMVDAIVSHLRGNFVRAIHSLYGRKLEILVCDIAPNSKAAEKELKDIPDFSECLALLIRQPGSDVCEIPRGSTVMHSGATVVLIVPVGDKRIVRIFCGKSRGIT